jgi:DNA-binding SARP family transcriptional activator
MVASDDGVDWEPVQIEILGVVRAHVSGTVLEGARLGSLKARQLIVALAIEAPLRLTTEQLVDRLWICPPDGAERIVTGLVSRVRRALGRPAVEGNARSGYRLASEVSIDLRHAEELLARLTAAQASGDAAELLSLAKGAVAVLSGGMLATDDRSGFEWIEEARRYIDACLVRARSVGARAALANSDAALAIEFAHEVRKADPFDEDALALLMRAYAESGGPAEALRAFARFRAEHFDDIGGLPAKEINELADRIRSSIVAHSASVDEEVDLGDRGPLAEIVVDAAAVIGRTFDTDQVAALCSLDPVQVHLLLGRARIEGLIVEDSTNYRFSDGQRWTDVLNAISPPLRRSLHRRAAELFGYDPVRAAAHREAAGDWKAARAEWRRAAAEAKAGFNLVDAEAHLGRAITAANHCGEVGERARCRIDRGHVREQLGRYASALEDHRHAIDLARDGGLLDLENAALERAAWTLYYARNTDSAEDLADRALPWCEQVCRSPTAPATARVLLGRLRHSTGDLAGADAVLDSVDPATLDFPDQVAAGVIVAVHRAHHDRYSDAFASAERAARTARASGEYRDVLTSTLVAAVASFNAGWFAAALDRVEVVSTLSGEFDDPSYQVRALTMEAVIRLELGDLRKAAELATRAAALAKQVRGGTTHSGLHAQLARAEAYMQLTGRLDDVLREPIPREVSYARRLELRRLELRARLEPEFAEELLERSTVDRAPKYQALAHQHLGHPDDARQLADLVGSDLLLSKVGSGRLRREAHARIAARLPIAVRGVYRAGR